MRQDIIVRDERGGLASYQPPQSFGGNLPAETAEPSLLGAIWRHVWIVVLCAIAGAGGALVYLKKAKPLYSSVSRITLEPTGPKVLTETLGTTERSNYLYTQAELLKSTPLLKMVAEMPGIKDLKTFEITSGNPVLYLRDPSLLTAEVGRKDDIIDIEVTSPYPDDAAKIVNAVVQAYKDYQYTEKKTSGSMMLDTLNASKEAADKEYQALDAQKIEFERTHPELKVGTIFDEQLRTLSTQYTNAELATVEAKASYAPGHPLLQRAQQKEEALYSRYNDKLSQSMHTHSMSVDYEKIVSDETIKQDFVKKLDERIKELQVNQDAQKIFNAIDVLEPGAVPDEPSFPRKHRTMAVAIAAGALIGCGLALLRDRLDGRMRSIEEIQTIIGLPILGVVPGMSGRRTAVARAMTVHLDPRSVVAEAYRTVRTAVYFSNNGSHSKTILITSPEPGDGKTTSASNLAIAIAQTGRSVLLLDADFRKPTQHKNLDIKDATGLSSVLSGQETLERAIQRTGVEGLDILPCGPIPANPSEILNSKEFADLIEQLSNRYDHILFDSPPVNPVTDARILAAVCDSTILVVRADKSTRKSTEHARNALLAVGARVLGVIVNDTPSKRRYDVYGGTYYGPTDASIRPSDSYPSSTTGIARVSPTVGQGAGLV